METTLFRVPAGSSFWFGGVQFIKTDRTYYKMIACTVYGSTCTVHITDAAWVRMEQE